ncbi:XtrA/YqaO family protein [Sutcliffiella sp. BMC8]|uniref:XtrA/YqaO family protein n=1 Tax=Sutcliffiella sp. BMC8 TaxID=3073243 RepID=UPI0030CF68FE
MHLDIEKMTAEIDLMNNQKLYVVKDGKVIEHDLPAYGETVIITLGGKVDRLETTVRTKV